MVSPSSDPGPSPLITSTHEPVVQVRDGGWEADGKQEEGSHGPPTMTETPPSLRRAEGPAPGLCQEHHAPTLLMMS
ncbi:hypothetical protein DPEC_G00052720 [Dallia pectoralis]|uniref:Uncharacterized protein n=1 Tax=Dallia pectoralis TaxID=75939 RepID=A0ACC2HCF8_DALPE|nr:hypothetical protein DPEC_G00052720 [Dallia pectoralis]